MSILCKAAVANGKGGFSIGEIVIDAPAPDEVLVKMKAAGLCHTDYDSLRWGKPLILGHEGAGVVMETGSAVEGIRPGDSVMLNWAMPCGECFQCRAGNEHICEINSPVVAGGNGYTAGHATLASTRYKGEPILRSFNLGTLAEYVLVKAAAVVVNPLPDMSFVSASIVSCAVMTGYGSVINAAKVKSGSSVVVLGAGGVGLNVMQGARIAKAATIIAIDVNEQKLDLALRFGATHILKADKEDKGLLRAARQVREMTGGRGADYAFECTAIPALGMAPLAMVRNAGMAVQVSGIEQEIVADMNLFEWDKIYINPLYGQCRPQVDFPRIIDHYRKGELLLDELVTHTFPLDQLGQAFDSLLAGRHAKAAITFDDPFLQQS